MLVQTLGTSTGQMLTEEEIEARKGRLKTLILLGKERGYLTHGEINDHLPDIQLDSDQMESIVITFNEWNIAVYEHTPDTEALLLSEESAASVQSRECCLSAKLNCRRQSGQVSHPPIGAKNIR